jgi:heme-degrading monooxygenase HmoA
MHVIVWRFTPRPGREAEFESTYAAGGAWDLLFRQAQGFVSTELLRPAGDSTSYVTIDRWRSAAAFADFLRVSKEAYAALDAECESLTSEEARIGSFSVVPPAQR